jgi:hypothetical protein
MAWVVLHRRRRKKGIGVANRLLRRVGRRFRVVIVVLHASREFSSSHSFSGEIFFLGLPCCGLVVWVCNAGCMSRRDKRRLTVGLQGGMFEKPWSMVKARATSSASTISQNSHLVLFTLHTCCLRAVSVIGTTPSGAVG